MTERQPHEGDLHPTGMTQEFTPHRQESAGHRLDDLYDYATKARTHLWIVMVTHLAGETVLDHQDGRTTQVATLDVESAVGRPVIACYVCEVAYQPRLRRRRCPGDPAPHLAGRKM